MVSPITLDMHFSVKFRPILTNSLLLTKLNKMGKLKKGKFTFAQELLQSYVPVKQGPLVSDYRLSDDHQRPTEELIN